MIAKTFSTIVLGIDAHLIEVEVDVWCRNHKLFFVNLNLCIPIKI